MSLWSSDAAIAATLGEASKAFAVNGLSIDTRTLKPGDLFVALKGDARDGHDFVSAALAAKAGAALVSRQPDGVAADAPLLTVANTLRGLEDLAHAARARSNAKIVAVTGSAGKTTTKEMLRMCFDALGRTHASAASYNNHWGVPLSLAGLPQDSQFGVFEVGMNHAGEIRALVALVRPHVALIPSDSPYAARLAARAGQAKVARVVRFGQTGEAKLLSWMPDSAGMRVKADILGRAVDCLVGAPGLHIAQNAVAALAAVALAEGDVLNAAAALKDFAPLKGRGERFEADGVNVIDESYNANPASMAAALALLGAAQATRRIAVLGDMLEMGEGGAAHHAGLAAPIAAANTDLVFAAGPAMKSLWDALPAARQGGYAATSAELAPMLAAALKEGDTVLVKGSLGSKMAVIIASLKARGA